jgi:hypothetical protein
MCGGENDMPTNIAAAVLSDIKAAIAGAMVVLVAIAWLRYRASK